MNKTRLKKSVVAGIALESLSLLPLALSGFGPCGPSSPIGILAILLQLPFILVLSPISSALDNGYVGMTLIFLLGSATWSALSYWLLSVKERKASSMGEESGKAK